MPAATPSDSAGARRSSAGRALLRRQVRDALTHLHDTNRLQTHPLARFVQGASVLAGCSAGRALRRELIGLIESLRPGPDLSSGSLAHRTYRILRLRYVEDLEVSQVRDRLALSKSAYYSGQQRAIEEVTAVLVDRWGLGEELEPGAREAPTNLPVPPTSFVGRAREMAQVKGLLGTTRLLTLTGAGGCGKSRLAAECARGLLGDYPEGVWLAALTSVADQTLVPQTVAAALGIREDSRLPALEALVSHLGPRRSLLLLDNCEHLLEACASLAERLLEACPSLAILATSRQPLGIGGEITFRVPSLSSPSPDLRRSPEDLLEEVLSHDATRLFVDRARMALRAFEPSTSNVLAIAEVCRRLDGIPLAIELAAAQARALAPEEIATRLDRDFNPLAGGRRDTMPRQQTVQGTLDWGHSLLSEPERRLFRRLSVFAGDFSADEAQFICSEDGAEERDALDHLTQLVNASLVEVQPSAAGSRYRLLEPVRQYARRRLEAAGETASVRDQHLRWWLRLAARAEEGLSGPDQRTWLDRLDQQNPGLRAALSWGLETNAEPGLELAGRVLVFWERRCYYREGYHWLTELLRIAPAGASRERRAAALRGAGVLARPFLSRDAARDLLEESLALCREVGEQRETARTLIALLGHLVGDDAGDAYLEEAETIARDLGDRYLLGRALLNRSLKAEERGDDGLARALAEQSLALLEAYGDPHYAGLARLTLGRLLAPDGDPVRARELLERALTDLRGERETFGPTMALWLLAELAWKAGDRGRARALLTENAAPGRDFSWPSQVPYLIYLAGHRQASRGATERGVRLYAAANAAVPGLPEPYDKAGEPGRPALGGPAIAEARSALGEEMFIRLWAEGQAMTLDQAVEYALQGTT